MEAPQLDPLVFATNTRKGRAGMERAWISLDEAAEYVGVSTRTIRVWIAEGRLPAKRFGKRIIRVRIADVEACGRDIPTV